MVYKFDHLHPMYAIEMGIFAGVSSTYISGM